MILEIAAFIFLMIVACMTGLFMIGVVNGLLDLVPSYEERRHAKILKEIKALEKKDE